LRCWNTICIATSDHHLLVSLKDALRDHPFNTDHEANELVHKSLTTQPTFFSQGIQKLVHCWAKHDGDHKDYVDYYTFSIIAVALIKKKNTVQVLSDPPVYNSYKKYCHYFR